MELKTQALDRLFEALSPALAAELDRVVLETRETLEREFHKRLQAAVHDAESAARAASDSELEHAIAEAAETAKNKVTEELEVQFQAKLSESTTQLQDKVSSERVQFQEESLAERVRLQEEAAVELRRLREESAVERDRLQEQLDQWRVFAESQRQLAEASSQPEILSRFLRLAEPFAEGLAVYVTKTDGLALWKSRGNGAFPEIISQQTTDPESYFRPLAVRGKTVGAVCAAPSFKLEALDYLAASLERAIEVFGLRLRTRAAPLP